MDVQICSACCGVNPADMSIRLKNCQHPFCVPCLKYAMMDQGSADLQCPYPVGMFECGISLNEDEVQYILDFEEEEFSDGSTDATIEELEQSLDRVLTIDADEFPGVSEEDLPNVRALDYSEGSIAIENAVMEKNQLQKHGTEEDFGQFQERCLKTAEAVIPNTVHCLTPNCRGSVEMIEEVESFDCLICDVTNCVSGKAIHGNQSCKDYQANIQRKDDEIKSEATLRTLDETREGMRCPKCGVMITKIAGCDFMTCTTCKTGICWPTRGPRWGPAGQGDISGGCRCQVVNGKRCHPDCEGCH